MIAKAAKEFDLHIVAGSIPEHDASDDRIYNTCIVFDNRGEMLCKFRKVRFELKKNRSVLKLVDTPLRHQCAWWHKVHRVGNALAWQFASNIQHGRV